jgi:nucleoid-associated protein EbfC
MCATMSSAHPLAMTQQLKRTERAMKNLGAVMKQVQEMQARMQDMQAKLAEMTVTGQSGGGLVKMTLNGKGTLTATEIDASLLKADEKEILEDLIVAAHADAKGRLEQLVAEEMKSITGGLPLPPGFQLPF